MDDMRRIAATEAKNRLGALLDDAQREPIIISKQDRDVAVILSISEFERMRSSNARAFIELRDEVAEEARGKGLTTKRLSQLLANAD